MNRFGEHLLACSAIGKGQLAEALAAQRVYGGRLGTNLLELGYLVLEDLAEHLTRFHDIPAPPIDWVEQPDEAALKLVPSSLVRRLQLLPLRAERNRIHVAMSDPRDADQLAMVEHAASRPVTPYVLPEVRLLYWLEIHCDIDRHPRYVNLAARVRQTGGAIDLPEPPLLQPLAHRQALSSLPGPAPGTHASGSDRDEDFAIGGPDAAELLLEELAIRPPATGLLARPTGPGEIATLEAQLQGSEDRDSVIELGLRIASGFARCAVLFLVRGTLVIGHRASGGCVEGDLTAVQIPIHTPTVFAQPALTASTYRGRPEHDGIDGRVLSAIGRADVNEVLLQPISIRGRVVNLLYADNGSDALGDTQAAALGALAQTMSSAFERLILEAKRPT